MTRTPAPPPPSSPSPAAAVADLLGAEALPRPWWRRRGVWLGALLALAAGWWSLREVLRRPVVETLRRAVSE